MEKLVYLLGDTDAGTTPRSRDDLRDRIFSVVPALESAGGKSLTISVADVADPAAEGIAQGNAHGLIDGQISLWLDHVDARGEVEAIVRGLATRHAGYLVTESILREYPDRSWKRGEASPGVTILSTFPKSDALDLETFYARWHGSHGPLSLLLHPLTRYVRNSVFRPLTENAPTLHGIVSESVGSCAVAADPEIFYSGRENRKKLVKDMLSFLDFETVSSVAMREYLF
ncbi:MAG: EthD domain-containing protein [bacterium]|nr:EthD domain-containing protein [bacterium]